MLAQILKNILYACLCWLLFSLPGRVRSLGENSFPDTDSLIERVAQNQKKVESLLNQYTFTNNETVYMLDKKGQARRQHSNTYYITPTPYEFFVIHVARDGKPVSKSNLKKQEEEITRKLQEYEKKRPTPDNVHPKNSLLFADIVLKSRFTPLRWDKANGERVVVYSFEPKTQPRDKGDLAARIVEDLKGNMWISPEEGEIVRMEFSNVAPLTFGLGLLGNAKSFKGFVEQKKVHGEVWLPSHQEYVAEGRQLTQGYRMRQVDEFSDYLKATTDVFQQIHAPSSDNTEPR